MKLRLIGTIIRGMVYVIFLLVIHNWVRDLEIGFIDEIILILLLFSPVIIYFAFFDLLKINRSNQKKLDEILEMIRQKDLTEPIEAEQPELAEQAEPGKNEHD